MRPCLLLRAVIVAGVVLGFPTSLRGQWLAAVEVGADRYWGGSKATTPEDRSFRPYRSTVLALGLERRMQGWGVGLRLKYTSAGLALEGPDAVAAVKGVFDVFGASPELIYRLARVAGSNELLIRAGPLFEVWSIIDEDSKLRMGLQAALAFTVPLGDRFAGTLLGGGAVSPSPFSRTQLTDGFEPRMLWRRGIAVRLEYWL